MKRFIRLKGLAAFVIIIAVFGIFWFLFADGIVKNLIQKYGSRAVGAKVELKAADLSLFPMGLKLDQLQVTDPDSPMKNAVEIRQISFGLEPLNLLRRKVIIKEMIVDGIQLGTSRKTSGAMKSRKMPRKAAEVGEAGKEAKGGPLAVKGPCGAISLPSFQVPDVHKILQMEQLHSLALLDPLRKDIQGEKAKWQDTLAKLPDKKKFDDYRARLDKLKSAKQGGISGLLGSASELSILQKDIRRDLEAIKTAQKEFGNEMASFKARLAEAKTAPLKDVARLKEKYSLSSAGLKHLSRTLLGSRLCRLVQKGVAWYRKLEPMVERARKKEKGHEVIKPVRGKGVDVRFKEYEPLPDFLVRTAKARIMLQAGDISGLIRNITPDQDVLGRPLTYTFTGTKLKGLQSIDLHGTLDHVVPASAKDTANLTLKGYQVKDLMLSDSKAFPLRLDHALADLKMDALLKGNSIKATLTSGFDSVKLSGESGEKESPIKAALLSSLTGISRFHVNADIHGKLTDYTIGLTSDLDRAFADAAGRAVKEQAADFEKKLKKAVMAKVEGPLQSTGKEMGGLNAIGQELTGRLNMGNSLLGNLKGVTGKGGLKLPF